MAIRDFIRQLTPQVLLDKHRNNKKGKIRKQLESEENQGLGLDQSELEIQFRSMGIEEGDVLLVHASFSKIGFVKGGPQTLIDALLSILGESGHLLMPSSSNPSLQVDFLKTITQFDSRNDASVMGVLSESFRKMKGVKRSLHPTESVVCFGPKSEWFTETHHTQQTAYDTESPWYKVAEKSGKILYLGVGIERSTSLHLMEDAVEDFKYDVYLPEIAEVKVIDDSGNEIMVQTKIHNPIWSKQRKCIDLVPLFEQTAVLSHYKLGEANCQILNAKLMLEVMISAYYQKGITMYTPFGS